MSEDGWELGRRPFRRLVGSYRGYRVKVKSDSGVYIGQEGMQVSPPKLYFTVYVPKGVIGPAGFRQIGWFLALFTKVKVEVRHGVFTADDPHELSGVSFRRAAPVL